jgi:ACS family glucarate transporter-like MFS transporter
MSLAPLTVDADAPVRPTWVRWRIVLILMGFTALNHFHRQSLPAVVHEIMRDTGLSETEMGWIFAALLSGYVFFMVPGGRLADLRGGWLALVITGFGTAALVTATASCGAGLLAAATFSSFVAVRFLFGAFTGPLFPAAGRIVVAWVPFRNQAWANGLVLGATTVGITLAPVAFGTLSDEIGWRRACVVMGAVTALLASVWFWYGRDRPAEHPGTNEAERALVSPSEARTMPRGGDFIEWLKNRDLILLTCNYAAVGYYEYMLFYWINHYFVTVHGCSEDKSRLLTSIVTSAMLFAMPLGGLLSDRLVRAWGYRAGRTVVPVVGMLASAGLLFAATRAEDLTHAVAFFFLAHAAISLCEAPTWVAGLEIGGEHCATAAAIVNTGGNLGGLAAPVVTAYVARAFGWNAGFLVASGVCMVGVLLWFGIRLKRPATEQPAN